VRIAIAYPLVWDLMRWTTELGGAWFDLGGVTLGRGGDPEDPLGGISDFKRFFSRDLAEVRQTWRLPPRTLRSWLAQTASRLR
jgi:lipid II:glycine glycyltransferase (peptidoglycan interpeptide bridge formation enzyme)